MLDYMKLKLTLNSPPTFSNIAFVLGIFSISALLCKALYNRYLHPLRNFPGPFWASLSRAWWILVAIGGRQHEIHVACHEKYGPIVRVTPHFIMLNDAEYVTQYYKWNRSDYTLPFEVVPGEAGVTTKADMKAHAKQRKKVAAGFSLSAVQQNEDLIDKHIVAWIAQLRRRVSSGGRLAFGEWAQWLAMDIVMDVGFGAPMGFVAEGKDIRNLLAGIQKTFVLATVLSYLPAVVKFMQIPLIWSLAAPTLEDKSGVGVIMGVGDEAIRKRLEEGNVGKKRDVLQHWIEHRDREGEGMTEDEMKLEAFGPILVGSDTTATAIRAIVLNVASKPRIYNKLMAKITPVKSGHPVKYQEAQKLPYLQAIISEALRIYSPVGTPLSRVIPPGGATIRGHSLPGGTWIMMPQWCLGHSKTVYGADADMFRPERWLREEGEDEQTANARLERLKKADSSFGRGEVTCLGRNIAMMEMSKAIVELFWNFDIQVVNPERSWKMTNVMIFIHKEFWLQLTPRKVEAGL